MHRFYLPDFEQPVLDPAESHHAVDVLRIKPGEVINVFDGRGAEAQCRVTETGKDAVRCAILQRFQSSPLPVRITLAQAIPKQHMDFIVEKATELGVSVIVPLISERTIKRPAAASRWREIALEACKQCGNNFLPEIQPPQSINEFFTRVAAFDLKLIASLQPDAKTLKQLLTTSGLAHVAAVLVLIGPEGDFSDAELDAAKSAGCQPLSLGPLVLRAETAALYALSILHYELEVSL